MPPLVDHPAVTRTIPRGRVGRNFFASLSAELAGQAIAFLAGIYLARTLGPQGFGVWVFAASIVLYATVLVDGGTELWGTREVSARPSELGRIVRRVVALRLALAVPALVALLAFAAFVGAERRLALLYGCIGVFALALTPSFAHRGLESIKPALALLLQRALMLGLALWLVREPADAAQVTLWQGLSEIVACIFLLAALAPRLRDGAQGHGPSDVKDTFVAAWPLGVSRALRSLPAVFVPVMLGFAASDIDVGNYGVALRLSVLVLIVSNAFQHAAFPALARVCLAGGERETQVLEAACRLLGMLIAPLAVACVVLAEPIVALVFSTRFVPAAPSFAVLTAASFCMALNDLLRRALMARHRQRLDLLLTSLTTVATLAAIALATPRFGPLGAAAAALAGEVMLLALCERSLDRTGSRFSLWRALAPSTLAAAAVGLVSIMLRQQPLWLTVAAIGALYGGWLWSMRLRILADIRRLDARADGDTTSEASDTRPPSKPGNPRIVDNPTAMNEPASRREESTDTTHR